MLANSSSRNLPVTTVTPMKRGLKGRDDTPDGCRNLCYNRYPDEKGTERGEGEALASQLTRVTTVTPMKRGLKDSIT